MIAYPKTKVNGWSFIDDTVGLYCAAIGFICSLFCFPTNAQVSNDIQEDEED